MFLNIITKEREKGNRKKYFNHWLEYFKKGNRINIDREILRKHIVEIINLNLIIETIENHGHFLYFSIFVSDIILYQNLFHTSKNKRI